jgi:hypothetical protein
MALPSTCTLEPADYNDGIATQNPILRSEIIRFIALNDPYSNVFDGGTTQSNAGDTIKTLVTGRVVTNQSLVQPVFDTAISSCGISGEAAEFGQTEFTTYLENMRGKGPTICVKQARNSVIESFNIAGQNLKDGIKSLMSADNRNQLLVKSGVKAVLKSGATQLSQILTGGYNEVSVAFLNTGLPTSPVSHKFLVALANYMRDNLSPEFFGDGAGQYFVFISSSDQTEVLRNEAGLKQELLAFVTGNDKGVGDSLKKYAFIDYPYRGIKLAIDQQPLRFNTVNGLGFPVLIEPLTRTPTDYGVQNLTNPTWVAAQYEVGFLVSKGAFRRLVPERYVGEGSFKFEPQFTMGELLWRNIIDNTCNPFGDFGFHLYQIERAIQARRPHGVIPVLYKRCAQDLGLSTCTSTTDLTV